MLPDNEKQGFIGQNDFSGGMNCLAPAEKQFKDGLNLIIRDGYPTTRPGVRMYMAAMGGYISGFWFNQDAEKFNDADHTGFWFPFDFVRTILGTETIQGCALIRLSCHDENKIIFGIGGAIFLYEKGGYVTEVPTSETIGATEELDFVQANNKVTLFRGEDETELVWDGDDDESGFVALATPVGDAIKPSASGVYHGGRLWITNGDDVYASDILDLHEYDYTNQCWSAWRLREEAGVYLFPFHEDGLLLFKKKGVALLTGTNAVIVTGTTMADYVRVQVVDDKTGALARNAIVSVGEDVWYLGYNGIYSLKRNVQNKIERDPTAVSVPVQPYIDRINWGAAGCACATFYKNHVIFAVPVDGSTTNNMLLVYDKIREAWCGPWTSSALNPVKFFQDDDKLIFLSADHKVRIMFTDDPWDSETPYSDTPAYSATKTYEPGELVYYANPGDRIYRCTATSLDNLPSDADFWEEETDVRSLYDIESWIQTRVIKPENISGPIRYSRAEVLFDHQNPLTTLSILSEEHGTEQAIFADRTYPYTEWDIVRDDWDETNTDLNANEPHRKDYTLFVPESGIYMDPDGLYAGVWEQHALRFIPITISLWGLAIKIRNTRGKLKLKNIMMMIAGRRFASQERT